MLCKKCNRASGEYIICSVSDYNTCFKNITALCTKYGFINEVVNVLIEYVLKTSNNGFTKNYVETIASSWSRNNVDTYEKAVKQTNWKKKDKKQDLPDWYDEIPEEKADEQQLQELLNKISKIPLIII